MPQSLAKIILHIIFSTKDRQPLITATIKNGLFKFLATTCQDHGCFLFAVGGYVDHIHIVVFLAKTKAPADLIQHMKTDTSRWIKNHGREFANFHWQRGYGVFSVSESKLSLLRDYVANQEQHHQKQSFEDEFKMFLTKHDLKYDEQYLWG